MVVLSAGDLRPHVEQSPLHAGDVAKAMNIPARSVRRWLAAWFALNVPGIQRVPSEGRTGWRYVIEPWIPDAWRAGELPAPRVS